MDRLRNQRGVQVPVTCQGSICSRTDEPLGLDCPYMEGQARAHRRSRPRHRLECQGDPGLDTPGQLLAMAELVSQAKSLHTDAVVPRVESERLRVSGQPLAVDINE